MNANDVSSFGTIGAVTIPYNAELRRAVEAMEESWRAFCALPVELKQTFPYSTDSTGVGYEFKNTPGATLDLKENFHLTLGRYGWLMSAARATGIPEAVTLVKRCRDVALELQAEVESFAVKVEDVCGIPGFADEVVSSADSYYVRLIHYFGDRNAGDETATAHCDKSGFTFHLYEDTPGLERLTYDGTWVPMHVSPGETQVIPNMQLQYRTDGAIKATCHRVVATEASAKTGRYSAVCFVMLKNTPRYNKAAAGRLQEREPGFNYTCSPEAFAQLFTTE